MQEGVVSDPGTLQRWLENFVSHSLVPIEGPGVHWAWQWKMAEAGGGANQDMQEKWIDLDRRLTLTRLSRESREGGIKVAKRYLQMVMALYPESGLEWYRESIQEGQCFGHTAVIHGFVCAFLQQPVETAVLTHLYTSVNGLIQAALRGMSMGQTDAQKVLSCLLPLLSVKAKEITEHPPLPHQIYGCTLHQEVAAMRHEFLYSRLFTS